jgi:pilus assembly protein CpaD
MTVLLGACAVREPAPWAETVRPIDVRYSHRDLDLAFPAGSATLPISEAARLRTLLDESGPGEGLRAIVGAASGNPLSARRVAAISRVLEAHGIQASEAVAAAPENQVRVMLGRYAITPSPCAEDGLASMAADYPLSVRAQGCTTANNLAAMLADPGDLVAPRGGGAFDAVPAAAAVNRYRNDRTFPLMDTPDLPFHSTAGVPQPNAPAGTSGANAAGGGP